MRITRLRVAGLSIVFGVVAAASRPAAQPTHPAGAAPPDDRTVVHVLNRLGFGPSASTIERLRTLGLPAYIDEQLHPERIADSALRTRLNAFTTLGMTSRELATEYFVPARVARRERQRLRPVQRKQPGKGPSEPHPARDSSMPPAQSPLAELAHQKLLRAIYSKRQLEEVLVDFWFNHFNVFAGNGQVRLYLTEYERDAIRPHVLGRFRDLLGATAHSPAMLFYLDNWQSAAEAGARTSADTTRAERAVQRRRAPRARNRAVPVIAPDRLALPTRAQPMRRRGLNENYARELMELHTLGVDGGYTQQDVREVARAFTGWTIDTPRLGGTFRFEPRLHDDGEKVVLGHRIKAGGGQSDGERVLDLLAAHPSTARFIATKLARRLVSDTPPPRLVARAAARFTATRGDLREVVRTIITSPEFLAPEAYRVKVKNPFEFVTSAVRATGDEPTNVMPLVRALRDLGMPLYGAQPPTGYLDRADAWVNSGALLNRMNVAIALTSGRLRAARAPERTGGGAEDAARRLLGVALAGDVSDSTARIVARAETPSQAIALVLGSPEFQKR
jgi:uncharacterized protein (DUF1800 family)